MDISNTWFYVGSFNNGEETVTAKYDFDIDWGDGSPIEHFDNSMAKINGCLDVNHTYKKPGIYKVTLTGDCDNLYGHGKDSPGYYSAKNSHAVQYWLWGVVVPKNSWSPLKYGYGSFFGA